MREAIDSDVSKNLAEEDGQRFRTTVTLTEQELTSLDELRVHFRRVEKRKVDQSQLIREAIRHYRAALLTTS